MTQITLTEEMIKADITVYRDRIHKAQDKLDALLVSGRNPDAGRKLKATRNRLEAEVAHVLGLIRLASEALAEHEKTDDDAIK